MQDDLPYPFDIYMKVFQGDHLHFGYWPQGVDATLEQAQENLFELILRHIPSSPARILDVGCGLGESACRLAGMGHEVSALAPSGSLIELARRKYSHENLRFVHSGFLEYAGEYAEKKFFDILLFQESLQYLSPLDRVFSLCRKLLTPKGRIVLCDETLNDPDLREMTAVHPLKEIKASLLENGFCIKKIADIGKNVSPTCDRIISRLEQKRKELEKYDQQGYEDLLAGWRNQKKWYAGSQFSYTVMNVYKDMFFLKPYQEGDEERIVPLFNEVFNAQRRIKHWTWKYENNPCGRGVAALAVDSSSNIAGHLSAYPVRFFSLIPGSESFVALQAGDVMTSRACRNIGLGPTSILSRVNDYFSDRLCSGRYPFFYGFNTGNMRKYSERYLGYEYIDPVPFYTLQRCTDFEPGWKRWSRRFFERVNLKKINQPDAELDVFFDSVAADYEMIAVRDQRYLQWRYFDSPDSVYCMYGLYFAGRLSGWAVFKENGDELIMGDFLFGKQSINRLGYLLEHVFRAHPEAGYISAWCSPNPQWCSQGLLNAGFQPGKQPDNLAPCFNIFDSTFSIDFFQRGFYYTMGDSDLF